MYTQEEKEVLISIGEYYLAKNNKDYDKTGDDLVRLQITNIKMIDTIVELETARPGILIGKRGTNIEELETFLKKSNGVTKLLIREAKECLFDIMMPQEDFEFDHDDYYCHPMFEDEQDIFENDDEDTPPPMFYHGVGW